MNSFRPAAFTLAAFFLAAPFASAGLLDGKHHHPKQSQEQKAAKAARKDTAIYAIVSPGAVTIKSGRDTLCKVNSAHPNIDGYRIIDEKFLAIKSRDGASAPALVELFDLHTGTLKDSVLAKEADPNQVWQGWAKE